MGTLLSGVLHNLCSLCVLRGNCSKLRPVDQLSESGFPLVPYKGMAQDSKETLTNLALKMQTKVENIYSSIRGVKGDSIRSSTASYLSNQSSELGSLVKSFENTLAKATRKSASDWKVE